MFNFKLLRPFRVIGSSLSVRLLGLLLVACLLLAMIVVVKYPVVSSVFTIFSLLAWVDWIAACVAESPYLVFPPIVVKNAVR